MFAKLKKKVEDLEGSDLHKLANSISFTSAEKAVSQSGQLKSSDSLSASQSLRGSTTSLSSLQGTIRSDESEIFQAMEKKWRQRLLEVENEWRVKVMVHEHEKEQLTKDRDTVVQQKKKMEDDLREMRGYQEKYIKIEENLEKLQEAKSRETASLQLLLTNANLEVEDLKAKDDIMQEQLDKKEAEIKMLQLRFSDVKEEETTKTGTDQQANFLDVATKSEETEIQLKIVKETLAAKESELVRLQRQFDQVKSALDAMTQNWQDEKTLNLNLQDKLAQLSEEKNSFQVRNAELSQQMALSQQQLQRCERELNELSTKNIAIEEENKRVRHLLSDAEARDENSERVGKLRLQVSDMEAAISEKNKTIKLQQQRLADMKKTLQKELKNQNNDPDSLSPLSAVSPSLARKSGSPNTPAKSTEPTEEVNFKYLKHVIFKFLTSREYEAQHLTRAVSTLLKLTTDEEKLLKETLEWKMSWFRSKPDLGSGQSALYIPPTH